MAPSARLQGACAYRMTSSWAQTDQPHHLQAGSRFFRLHSGWSFYDDRYLWVSLQWIDHTLHAVHRCTQGTVGYRTDRFVSELPFCPTNESVYGPGFVQRVSRPRESTFQSASSSSSAQGAHRGIGLDEVRTGRVISFTCSLKQNVLPVGYLI